MIMSKNIPELYGSLVFNDKVMKRKLPGDVYRALRKTIETGSHLELDVANAVAVAMKEWAVENGATHFTHWFQPMTGITAEKHDSFIKPVGNDEIIMDFSGKELIKGEPDASSFPSGGLRATFEARGYTAWDPTSPAFIKDDTLCIPTAFCSYSGEALDTKTPLLRSMEALNKEALRVLHLFGNEDVTRVISTVGPEQEHFLVDKELFLKRTDLKFCGRTLFGAPAPKGQEMDDHYFGALRPRVAAFMKELDEELWKLGIPAKTRHNEVAPAQHELATIYTTANVAVDNNQLTMELMKRVAERHGLACLLHEKPFEGINGSGKHNNWSISTNTGKNLLDPDREPAKNLQFLLFLFATIQAVDVYGDLLRVSVATAGNDHRLGGNEAPPAIISMFLGDDLASVLDIVEQDLASRAREDVTMTAGARVLPHFVRDTTDRNRTSPFAFTGNKFEFRMPGSSLSVSEPNIVLNTAVAEVLSQFADRLEGFSGHELEEQIHILLKEVIRDHRRIVFNGNGYTDDWVAEAHRRGLYDLPTCAEAFPCLLADKNVALFTKHGVYTREEIESRYEIKEENYIKTIHIEAKTMISIMHKTFLPALFAFRSSFASGTAASKALLPSMEVEKEETMIRKLTQFYTSITSKTELLSTYIAETDQQPDDAAKVNFFAHTLLPVMDEIRSLADEAETMIPASFLPYPTYEDLLFSV